MDGDKTNLRWDNLRACTHSQNKLHTPRLQANNTTGFRGVHYNSAEGWFGAELKFEYQRLFRNDGYDTAADAAVAYDRAVIENGLNDRIKTNSAMGRLPAGMEVEPVRKDLVAKPSAHPSN